MRCRDQIRIWLLTRHRLGDRVTFRVPTFQRYRENASVRVGLFVAAGVVKSANCWIGATTGARRIASGQRSRNRVFPVGPRRLMRAFRRYRHEVCANCGGEVIRVRARSSPSQTGCAVAADRRNERIDLPGRIVGDACPATTAEIHLITGKIAAYQRREADKPGSFPRGGSLWAKIVVSAARMRDLGLR